MTNVILFYLAIGAIACGLMRLIGRSRRGDFSPQVLWVIPTFSGLVAALLFWPIVISIQIVEWCFFKDAAESSVPKSPHERSIPAGTRGVAHTNLKPGGKIRLGDKIVDALSQSGMVRCGQEVEILSESPTGFRVRAVDEV